MSNEYNSKSAIILRRYTPEAIQELLNSGEPKSSIVERLGLYMEALNKYIKQHNLTYQPSRKPKKAQKRNTKEQNDYCRDKPSNYFTHEEIEDPVKKFYEILTQKREKRMLRELKNPYDW